MRELKFRAWDKKNSKFFNGRWCIGDDGGFYDMTSVIPEEWHRVDGFIIEQYTSLKDKNGKEIYEGDIVEYDWYIIGDKPAYRTKEQVVFDDMGARLGDDRIRYCTNVEVIGNIHENPELLEEK